MNEDFIKFLYETYVGDKGTYEDFKADLQDPDMQKFFHETYLQGKGSLDEFQQELAGAPDQEPEEFAQKYQDQIESARTSREGARPNEDGTESTHIMASSEADGKYYAHPTLFQDEEGNWFEPDDPFAEAQQRGELYKFDTPEDADKFAKGAWKSDEAPTVEEVEPEAKPPEKELSKEALYFRDKKARLEDYTMEQVYDVHMGEGQYNKRKEINQRTREDINEDLKHDAGFLDRVSRFEAKNGKINVWEYADNTKLPSFGTKKKWMTPDEIMDSEEIEKLTPQQLALLKEDIALADIMDYNLEKDKLNYYFEASDQALEQAEVDLIDEIGEEAFDSYSAAVKYFSEVNSGQRERDVAYEQEAKQLAQAVQDSDNFKRLSKLYTQRNVAIDEFNQLDEKYKNALIAQKADRYARRATKEEYKNASRWGKELLDTESFFARGIKRNVEFFEATGETIAALTGSDWAERKVSERASRNVPEGALYIPTGEPGKTSYKAAKVIDDDTGQVFEVGFEEDGTVFQIQDSEGFNVYLDTEFGEKLMNKAYASNAFEEAEIKRNWRGIYDAGLDSAFDVGVTMLTGSGAAKLLTKTAPKLAKNARFIEAAAIFPQFYGRGAVDHIRSGKLDPQEAALLSLFTTSLEAATEVFMPVAGKVATKKGFIKAATDKLANPEFLAAVGKMNNKVAAKEVLKGWANGMVSEFGEELFIEGATPLINQFANSYMNGEFEETEAPTPNEIVDLGLITGLASWMPVTMASAGDYGRLYSLDYAKGAFYKSVSPKLAETFDALGQAHIENGTITLQEWEEFNNTRTPLIEEAKKLEDSVPDTEENRELLENIIWDKHHKLFAEQRKAIAPNDQIKDKIQEKIDELDKNIESNLSKLSPEEGTPPRADVATDGQDGGRGETVPPFEEEPVPVDETKIPKEPPTKLEEDAEEEVQEEAPEEAELRLSQLKKDITEVVKTVKNKKKPTEEQIDASLKVVDAMADTWAKRTKREKSEFFDRFPLTIQKGDKRRLSKDADALFQSVWHGSPAKIEGNFSTSFIGQGEGNNAFGWGLYFSDSRKVANFYSRMGWKDRRTRMAKKFRGDDGKRYFAETFAGKSVFYRETPWLSYGAVERISRKEFEEATAGKQERHIYRVNAAIEGETLINYEEQITDKLYNKVKDYSYVKPDMTGFQAYEAIAFNEAPEVAAPPFDGAAPEVYVIDKDSLAAFNDGSIREPKWIHKRTGEVVTASKTKQRIKEATYKVASLDLLDKGIAGISYPIGTISGSTIEDGRNYVIFNENLLEIEEHIMLQKNADDVKGSIQKLADDSFLVSLFNTSDVSTLVHEFAGGHLARFVAEDIAMSGKDPDFSAAYNNLMQWAGVKEGKWTKSSEEKFARGFERYLRTGKAPNTELEPIFKRFKQWLTDIYNTIKGSPIDIPISKEVREFFDSLLTTDAKTQTKKKKQTQKQKTQGPKTKKKAEEPSETFFSSDSLGLLEEALGIPSEEEVERRGRRGYTATEDDFKAFKNRDKGAKGKQITSTKQVPNRTKLGALTRMLMPTIFGNNYNLVWHSADSVMNEYFAITGNEQQAAGINAFVDFNTKVPTIHISEDAPYTAVLHEVVHPFVAQVINDNKDLFNEFIAQLKRLNTANAKKALAFADSYTNFEEEALTEFLTNTAVNAMEEYASKSPNVFRRILEAVLKLVGWNKVHLDRLMRNHSDVISFGRAMGEALAKKRPVITSIKTTRGVRELLASDYKAELTPSERGRYSKAVELRDAGVPALDIKLNTGWEFNEDDGRWRLELDDYDAAFKFLPKFSQLQTQSFKLEELFSHPELYKKYPQLKAVDVKFDYVRPKATKSGKIIREDFYIGDGSIIRRGFTDKFVISLGALADGYTDILAAEQLNEYTDDPKYTEVLPFLIEKHKVYNRAVEQYPEDIPAQEAFMELNYPPHKQNIEYLLAKSKGLYYNNGKATPELQKLEFVINQATKYIDKSEGKVVKEDGTTGVAGIPSSDPFFTKTTADLYKATLLHELQHAIQSLEGLPSGGNIEVARANLTSEQKKEFNALVRPHKVALAEKRKLVAAGREVPYELQEVIDAPRNYLLDRYEEISGEVEARNVSERMYMTYGQRQNKLFVDTEKVPRDKQLIIYDNFGQPQHSMSRFEEIPIEGQPVSDEQSVLNLFKNKYGEVAGGAIGKITSQVIRNIAKRLGITEDQYRERLAWMSVPETQETPMEAVVTLLSPASREELFGLDTEILFQESDREWKLPKKFEGISKRSKKEPTMLHYRVLETFPHIYKGNITTEEIENAAGREMFDLVTRVSAGDFIVRTIRPGYLERLLERAKKDNLEGKLNDDEITALEYAIDNPDTYLDQERRVQQNDLNAIISYIHGNPAYSELEQLLIINDVAKFKTTVNSEGNIKRAKRSKGDVLESFFPIHSGNTPKISEFLRSTRAGSVSQLISDGNQAYMSELKSMLSGGADLSKYVHKETEGGVWYKFTRTDSKEDALALQKITSTSHLFPARWCTGGSVETARTQLSNGDFYVFVDSQGQARVAVRYNGQDHIAEPPRGLGAGQDIPSEDIHILEDFLSWAPGGEAYKGIVEDKKFLSSILKGPTLPNWLTKDDIKKAYNIESFAYGGRNDIFNKVFLKFQRNKNELAEKLGYSPDELAVSMDNITENTKVLLVSPEEIQDMALPMGGIGGDSLFLDELKSKSLEMIFGPLKLANSGVRDPGEWFSNLNFISGDLYLYSMYRTLPGDVDSEGTRHPVSFPNLEESAGIHIEDSNIVAPKLKEAVNISLTRSSGAFPELTTVRRLAIKNTTRYGKLPPPNTLTVGPVRELERINTMGNVEVVGAAPIHVDILETQTKEGEHTKISDIQEVRELVAFGQGSVVIQRIGNLDRMEVSHSGEVSILEYNANRKISGFLPSITVFRGTLNLNTSSPHIMASITAGKNGRVNIKGNSARGTMIEGPLRFHAGAGKITTESISQIKSLTLTDLNKFEALTPIQFVNDLFIQHETDVYGVLSGIEKAGQLYLSGENATIETLEEVQRLVSEGTTSSVYEFPELTTITQSISSNILSGGTLNLPNARHIELYYNIPTFLVDAPEDAFKEKFYKQDVRGAIIKAPGRSFILLGKESDPSTPLHEIAHEYERVLTSAERQVILDWAGHKQWKIETSEAFAKGFERFVYEGSTKNKGLQRIFENFWRWLRGVVTPVYFNNINALNDQVKEVYEAMVAADNTVSGVRENLKKGQGKKDRTKQRDTRKTGGMPKEELKRRILRYYMTDEYSKAVLRKGGSVAFRQLRDSIKKRFGVTVTIKELQEVTGITRPKRTRVKEGEKEPMFKLFFPFAENLQEVEAFLPFEIKEAFEKARQIDEKHVKWLSTFPARFMKILVDPRVNPEVAKALVGDEDAGKKMSIGTKEAEEQAKLVLEALDDLEYEDKKAAYKNLAYKILADHTNPAGPVIDMNSKVDLAILNNLSMFLEHSGELDTVKDIAKHIVHVGSLAGDILGVYGQGFGTETLIGTIRIGAMKDAMDALDKPLGDDTETGQKKLIRLVAEAQFTPEEIDTIMGAIGMKTEAQLKKDAKKAQKKREREDEKFIEAFKKRLKKTESVGRNNIRRREGRKEFYETLNNIKKLVGTVYGVRLALRPGETAPSPLEEIGDDLKAELIKLATRAYKAHGSIAAAEDMFMGELEKLGLAEALEGAIDKMISDGLLEEGTDLFRLVFTSPEFRTTKYKINREATRSLIRSKFKELGTKTSYGFIDVFLGELANVVRPKSRLTVDVDNYVWEALPSSVNRIMAPRKKKAEISIERYEAGRTSHRGLMAEIDAINRDLKAALSKEDPTLLDYEIPLLRINYANEAQAGDTVTIGKAKVTWDGKNWVNYRGIPLAGESKETAQSLFMQKFTTVKHINSTIEELNTREPTEEELKRAFRNWNSKNRTIEQQNRIEEIIYYAYGIDISNSGREVADRMDVQVDYDLGRRKFREVLKKVYSSTEKLEAHSEIMKAFNFNPLEADEVLRRLGNVIDSEVMKNKQKVVEKYIKDKGAIKEAMKLIKDGRLSGGELINVFGKDYGFKGLVGDKAEEFMSLVKDLEAATIKIDRNRALARLQDFLINNRKTPKIREFFMVLTDLLYRSMLNAPITFFSSFVGGGAIVTADVITDQLASSVFALTRLFQGKLGPKAAAKAQGVVSYAILKGFQSFFTRGIPESLYIFRTGESSTTYLNVDPRTIRKSKAHKLLIGYHNEIMNDVGNKVLAILGAKYHKESIPSATWKLLQSVVLAPFSFMYRMASVVLIGDALIRSFSAPYTVVMKKYYEIMSGGDPDLTNFYSKVNMALGHTEAATEELKKEFLDEDFIDSLDGANIVERVGRTLDWNASKVYRKVQLQNYFSDNYLMDLANRFAERPAMMNTPEGLLGWAANSLAAFIQPKVDETGKPKISNELFSGLANTAKAIFVPFVLKLGPNMMNMAMGFSPINLLKLGSYYGIRWTGEGVSKLTPYMKSGDNIKEIAQGINPFMVKTYRGFGKQRTTDVHEMDIHEKVNYLSRALTGTALLFALLGTMFDIDQECKDDDPSKCKWVIKDKGLDFRITGPGTGSYTKNKSLDRGYENNALQRYDYTQNKWVTILKTDKHPLGLALKPLGYMHDLVFVQDPDISIGDEQLRAHEFNSFLGASKNIMLNSLKFAFIDGLWKDIADAAGYISSSEAAPKQDNQAISKRARTIHYLSKKWQEPFLNIVLGGNFTKWASNQYLASGAEGKYVTTKPFLQPAADRLAALSDFGLTAEETARFLNSKSDEPIFYQEKYDAFGNRDIPPWNAFSDMNILDEAFKEDTQEYNLLKKEVQSDPKVSFSMYRMPGNTLIEGVTVNKENGELRVAVEALQPQLFNDLFEANKEYYDRRVYSKDVNPEDRYKPRRDILTSLRTYSINTAKVQAVVDVLKKEEKYADLNWEDFTSKSSKYKGPDGKALRYGNVGKLREFMSEEGISIKSDNTVKESDRPETVEKYKVKTKVQVRKQPTKKKPTSRKRKKRRAKGTSRYKTKTISEELYRSINPDE